MRWRPVRSRRRRTERRVRTRCWKSSNDRFQPNPRLRSTPSEPTTLSACTSAKWARWNSFRAKARLLSPSVETQDAEDRQGAAFARNPIGEEDDAHLGDL